MMKRNSLQHEIDRLSPRRTLQEYREAALTAIDFQIYSRLVTSLLKSDIGAVTLLDENSQFRLAESHLTGPSVIPNVVDRKNTICQYTLEQENSALVVPDLTEDERFKSLECVASGPNFKTYAGFPIKVREGFNIGAVCAIDRSAREWTSSEISVLEDLARMITNDLNLHFQTQSVLTQQEMQSSIVLFIRMNSQNQNDQDMTKTATWAKICQNATVVLRQTLKADQVFLLRVKKHRRLPASDNIEAELVGYDGKNEMKSQNVFITSDLLLHYLKISNPAGVFDKHSLPEELRPLVGEASQSVMISTWQSGEDVPEGLVLVCTDSSTPIFRAMERQYVEAFASTLMLELQKEKLADADRIKSDVISSLSHELRTPLHGLLHNVEVLLETRLEADQSELLREIASCGNSQLDIVESMLDLRMARGQKLTRDSIKLHDCVDVLEVVEEAVDRAVKRYARRHHVPSQQDRAGTLQDLKIVIDCPLGLGESSLRMKQTNSRALQQILGHLIFNSLKWTDEGYIKVEVFLQEHGVVINVCDTGAGIDALFLQNKVFQSFTKENSFTSGLGLGLSVVADLVSQLAGSIMIESEKGAFTTVKLEIPMQQADVLGPPALGALNNVEVGIVSPAAPVTKGEELLLNIIQRDVMSLGCTLYEVPETLHDMPVNLLIFPRKAFIPSQYQAVSMIFATEQPFPIQAPNSESKHKCLGSFYGPCKFNRLLSELVIAQKQTTMPNSLQPQGHKRTHSPEDEYYADRVRKNFARLAHSDSADFDGVISTKLATPERQSDTDILPRISPSKKPESDLSTLPSARVLIVEDNPLNSKLLVRFAEKEYLRPLAVMNGQEAVNAVKSVLDHGAEPFSLIFMDIQMPVLDGLQATKQIRDLEGARGYPPAHIVACTGLSTPEDKRKAAEVGCNQFLTKPISLSTLRNVIGALR